MRASTNDISSSDSDSPDLSSSDSDGARHEPDLERGEGKRVSPLSSGIHLRLTDPSRTATARVEHARFALGRSSRLLDAKVKHCTD